MMTPLGMLTPGAATPLGPNAMMATPLASKAHLLMTPEQIIAHRWEKEIDERNRPLSDEELDAIFPAGINL